MTPAPTTGDRPSDLAREYPLLTTKLYVPPVGPELVPRSRLIEQLDRGLAHKLVLVSAPAGFGKTTLLSEWISHTQVPVAWVSSDESDNDPVHFLAYVIAALQTIEGSIGRSVLEPLQARQPPAMEELLTALINQIQSVLVPLPWFWMTITSSPPSLFTTRLNSCSITCPKTCT